jgi:hypothetical protein
MTALSSIPAAGIGFAVFVWIFGRVSRPLLRSLLGHKQSLTDSLPQLLWAGMDGLTKRLKRSKPEVCEED